VFFYDHDLIEPISKPLEKYYWKHGQTRMIGSVSIMMEALLMPSGDIWAKFSNLVSVTPIWLVMAISRR